MSTTPEIRSFDVEPRTRRLMHRYKRLRKVQRAAKTLRAASEETSVMVPLPARQHGKGGERGRNRLHGLREVEVHGVPSTAHTSATAFPFLAGPSLGLEGPWLGDEVHGGGPFCVDPWELYNLGLISGMSALVFGMVGSGKSSLVKSWCLRLILAGRKLAVPSDLKGEWAPVIESVGGAVIRVAPGMDTRLNILDEGVRPELNQEGKPMSDRQWRFVVRQRRILLLRTVVLILRSAKDLDEHEDFALEDSLDEAVQLSEKDGRVPVSPDVRRALEQLHTSQETSEEMRRAADRLRLVLGRLETGDLAGMFDGESNVRMDGTLPAVGIDTSALRYASPTAARIVAACCGAWMEAMISEDQGQRIVVYEEGWDAIANEADLERMQKGWKLARYLGIFNVLILHRVSDLDSAGGKGTALAAMAEGLLADADIKVIYRQDNSALAKTNEKLELTDRENNLLRSLHKGQGLWRVKNSTFEVRNVLTEAEVPLLDTDQRMGKKSREKKPLARDWLQASSTEGIATASNNGRPERQKESAR